MISIDFTKNSWDLHGFLTDLFGGFELFKQQKKAGFYQKRLGFPDDPWVELI